MYLNFRFLDYQEHSLPKIKKRGPHKAAPLDEGVVTT